MATLDPNEALFVQAVSSKSGIDPRVLVAWIASEGHPGDEPGYFNYLNIAAPTAASLGVPAQVGPGNTARFGSFAAGVAATVQEIKNLGLSGLAGKTPRQAIASIAASPWAGSHYGGPGGPNLANAFASIFTSKGLDSSYQGPATALAVASTAGTGSAADAGSVDLNSVTSAAANAAKSASSALTGWVGDLTGWIQQEAGLALAYVLLIAVAGALFVAGLKGLGMPAPRLPRVVPVPA